MDAGGLSQMSYQNNNNFNNTIGVPGSGFASRGKGANLKRLSFAATETTIQDNGAPTPRTSRSHLLAGLRTAPKSATTGNFPPPSAPPSQTQYRGLDSSIYSDNKENQRMGYAGPKTSIGSTFNQQQRQQKHQQSYGNRNSQMYSLPEVLAPPEIHVDEHGQDQMDPNLYAQLVATNMYLAEQQQRLQQQLLNVQAAAQQFQGMNLNGINRMQQQQQQQFATPPVTPSYAMYGQQNKQNQQQIQNLQQSMQPIITAVPGAQAGLYSVYNPLTGQQAYYIDQSVANQNQLAQQQQQQNQYLDQHAEMFMENDIPQQPGTPRFQVSPPPSSTSGPSMGFNQRSISPPKKSTSPPAEHNPLPPPSATAFRMNRHKKASSLANVITSMTAADVESAPRSALPKTAGYPATPMTGLFGPGGSRAGEHPIRQPRGPPPIEELRAKPTSKFEGSKNFAARTRRSAVHNLVRAGLERRRAPGTGSSGSISPISEAGEFQFQSSGEDSDSGRSSARGGGLSGGLSGRPSLKSLKGMGMGMSVHGAIGSERPGSRSAMRGCEVDTRPTTASTSASASDCEGGEKRGQLATQAQQQPVTGSFAAAMKGQGEQMMAATKNRRAPMMVLSSAEKRKSEMF